MPGGQNGYGYLIGEKGQFLAAFHLFRIKPDHMNFLKRKTLIPYQGDPKILNPSTLTSSSCK